jgi:hypothetical protein
MSAKVHYQSISKSEAIREMMAQHPEAKARDIISLLADQGVKVQPSLVYLVRSNQKKDRRRQKRLRAVEASRDSGISNPVALIVRVKDLARNMGGLKNLQKLVDLLAE